MKVTVEFYADANDIEIVVAGMLGRGDAPTSITKDSLLDELKEIYEAHGYGWSDPMDIGYDDPVEDWDMVSKVVERVTGGAQ